MVTERKISQIATDVQHASPLPDKTRFGHGGTPETQTITMDSDLVIQVTGLKLSEINEVRSTIALRINDRFRSDVRYFSYIARCEITKVVAAKKESNFVFSVRYTFSRQRPR